jgi:hypothetical protein
MNKVRENIGTVMMVVASSVVIIYLLFVALGSSVNGCLLRNCLDDLVIVIGLGCFVLGKWLKDRYLVGHGRKENRPVFWIILILVVAFIIIWKFGGALIFIWRIVT